MSHDDSSRFMRAPLRGVNEFPLFLFLQEGDVTTSFSSSAIEATNREGGGGGDLNVRRNVSSPRAESSVKIGVEKYGDPAAALGPN